MADSKQAPLDAAAAAKAAFASVQGKPFPDDIFTAPELRWAVIGCGVIANQMAQSLALAGRKLAGVANRTLSKAQAFAKQYGVEKVYDTVEDLYSDPNIDAVYITTPHNTHITYLRAALTAGKHVLCEKAITLNSAELDEARAIADEHNVVLMDATTVLHMPLYQELRRIHRHFGCTIIFVTHDFLEARTLAGRAAILLDGKLQTVTDTSRLMDGHFSAEVERFLGRNQIITAPGRKQEKRIVQ